MKYLAERDAAAAIVLSFLAGINPGLAGIELRFDGFLFQGRQEGPRRALVYGGVFLGSQRCFSWSVWLVKKRLESQELDPQYLTLETPDKGDKYFALCIEGGRCNIREVPKVLIECAFQFGFDPPT